MNGLWAKKIRGQLYYFGVWDDPSAALARYLRDKDDLQAGRTPRPVKGEVTLCDLVNEFLAAKELAVDNGELARRSWADYHATCGRLLAGLGKNKLVADVRHDDFTRYRAALARRWGPVSVGNELNRIRVLFNWGHDAGLLEQEMRYGPGFKRPSAKTLRKARAAKGPRMFEAEEIRRLLGLSPWRAAADPHVGHRSSSRTAQMQHR